jgi:tripartite-type tricarboxylate transporter receptor subunit TctC
MALATGGVARADAVSDFYKGKQIQIIVGYGTGGGYDLYARLVARHFGRHVPGAPSVVVQNMPGAGSLRAANHIYNVAAKDGTVFGTFARSIPMVGVLGGNTNVRFDPNKFTWFGSPTSAQDDTYLLWARKDATVKSLAEAMKPGGPELLLGGTAEGSSDTAVANLIRRTVGVNMKIIGGYPDGNAINLAIERRELEGRFIGRTSVISTKPEWLLPNSTMQPLLQFARATRHPAFPDTPISREVAKDPRSRLLIELAEIPYLLSRPYVGPPGIPADRARALRAAFMTMGKDPEFLAEAQKLKLDVSVVGHEEAESMLVKLMAAPPDLKDELRKLVGSGE